MVEQRFLCPCCWEEISMILDLSGGDQAYIEDCEVCCRPLWIQYQVTADNEMEQVAGFSVAES